VNVASMHVRGIVYCITVSGLRPVLVRWLWQHLQRGGVELGWGLCGYGCQCMRRMHAMLHRLRRGRFCGSVREAPAWVRGVLRVLCVLRQPQRRGGEEEAVCFVVVLW
jgi:hypothetical protein